MLARRVCFLGSLVRRSVTYPDKSCPYCENNRTATIGRKFGLMQVRRCPQCGLMFRWPKDSSRSNYRFYQSRYTEGEVTDLPSESGLPALMARNFSGTPQDRSAKIGLLTTLKPPPARVLDFGCSWGYGTYQLAQAGYEAVGFEISKARAAFGRRKLGAKIISEYAELEAFPSASFDVIYSYHVVEHLATLNGVFGRFARLLANDGAVLLFAPNCGDGRGNLREGWKPIVGEKHPMALDTVFFRTAMAAQGFEVVALTSPFTAQEILHGLSSHPDNGAELAVYGKRKAFFDSQKTDIKTDRVPRGDAEGSARGTW